MGSVQTDVQGSNSSDAVSYTFTEKVVGDLMTDDTFRDLGVLINQERVRRGSSANAAIKDLADFTGVINYAEMEKLRSSLVVTGSNPPTYEGKADGSLITFSSGTNTPPTFTFTQAGGGFTDNPGQIEASPQNEWAGYPKITAALFNSLIRGLKEQGAECVCNCNYCTCNCNYCTCNCNFSCTCNCNYSDVTTKNNIVYM